jgi:hypothetical protein
MNSSIGRVAWPMVRTSDFSKLQLSRSLSMILAPDHCRAGRVGAAHVAATG